MPTADTYCRFYIHPSLTEGKRGTSSAVFDDVLYAEIFIKGSTNTSFSRAKIDKDEIDFAGEWAAYSKNEDYVNVGTSLSALPTIGPSAEMNLNAKGITTVEDLANLNDNVVLGESGMLDLRQRAQAYLSALNPEKEAREKQEATDEMTLLKEQIADMQLRLNGDHAVSPEEKLESGGPARGELLDNCIKSRDGGKPKRTRRKRNEETGELE